MDKFNKENKKGLTVTINAKFLLIAVLYLVLVALIIFDIINLYNLAELAKTLNSKISARGVFEFIFRVLFEVFIVVAIHYIAYQKTSDKAEKPFTTSAPEQIAAVVRTEPQRAASVKVELSQVFSFGGKDCEKQKELAGVHIVGNSWAGNKENAEAVQAGEQLFFEKREPSVHGANGIAVLTEAGGMVGFLPKDLQDQILRLIEAGGLFLVKAENSPLSSIAIGYYSAPANKGEV